MQGISSWSHAPYKPPLFDVGGIYICRVVPFKTSIHFEWLKTADEYKIYYRLRDEKDFVLAGSTDREEFDIVGLTPDVDWEFYVTDSNKKSRVRLARTGESVGTVVNYLHPEDRAYSYSGSYLASPSFIRHPDGYLLSSMDVFKGDGGQNLNLIFRSDDDGRTWRYQCELMPSFWGKLFLHKGEVYMISTSTEYGDLLIGKSTDGGRSFCTPTVLLRGSNGRKGGVGVHKNPQNTVYYKGRMYHTLEWGSWGNSSYYHAAMVMSIDENLDPMVAENWHFSEPLKYDPSWEGTVDGVALGTIEGTLCVTPSGELHNVMRYNIVSGDPIYGLVLDYKVDHLDPDAPLEYLGSIKLDGNNSKFMIKRDEATGKYYTIISRIDSAQNRKARNLLSLMESDDMYNWRLKRDLIDRRDADKRHVGFQYVCFEIEGDDIIYLCRTAINGANNFHDSNYQTFHRIKGFRA
ncbi:MAG: exo-alpha-sialidase [Ruminococcaceae bacterium]|nr:exo-alpha-sialidase [Oscillospiraceae bacterium]